MQIVKFTSLLVILLAHAGTSMLAMEQPTPSTPTVSRDAATENIVHLIASEDLKISPQKLTDKELNDWLAQDHSIDEPINSRNDRLLHIAARFNSLEAAKVLLGRPRDINVQNNDNNTPLSLAVNHDHRDMVQLLLDAGAIIQLKDRELAKKYPATETVLTTYISSTAQETLFSWLRKKTLDDEQLKSLVKLGADVNKPHHEILPLAIAAVFNPSALELLLTAGAHVNTRDSYGYTALHHAVGSAQEESVKKLVAWGADTAQKNNIGDTPLKLAQNLEKLPQQPLEKKNIYQNIIEFLQKAEKEPIPTDTIVNLVSKDDLTENLLHKWLSGGHRINEVVDPTTQETLLHIAAASNSNAAAGLILNQSKEKEILNAQDKQGRTPLFLAVLRDNENLAKMLIDAGADITIADPLAIAGNKNIRALLEAKMPANPKAQLAKSTGKHPLIDAIKANDSQLAQKLIDQGADVNEQDENGSTPLVALAVKPYAILSKESSQIRDLAQLLLAHGADMHHRNKMGYSALDFAIQTNNYEIVKILLAKGIDPNEKNPYGMTPLHVLMRNYGAIPIGGNRPQIVPETLEITKALLAAGADPRLTDEKGKNSLQLARSQIDSPWYQIYIASLHQAAAKGDTNLVDWLLNQGPEARESIDATLSPPYWKDLDTKANKKQTALHKAVLSGNLETTKLLLDAGANPNAQDDNGNTPLQIATNPAIRELLEQAQTMRMKPTAPRTISEVSKQPVSTHDITTAITDNKLTSGLLDNWLSQGNAIDKKIDTFENTLLHFTVENNKAGADILLDAGADINAPNKDKNTPLHLAAGLPDTTQAKLLLQRGAKIDVTNANKWTPLRIAIASGNKPMVNLLLEKGVKVTNQDIEQAPTGTVRRLLEGTIYKPVERVPATTIEGSKPMPTGFPGTPAGQPAAQPPTGGVPQGGQQPPVPETGANIVGTGVGGQIVYNRRDLLRNIFFGLGFITATAASYGAYKYLTSQELPTNLTKNELYTQLATALTNKNFEYAYKLAKRNPVSLREISADKAAQHGLAELIRQERANLFRETAISAESWYSLKHYLQPALPLQLKYLADLLHNLEQPTAQRST